MSVEVTAADRELAVELTPDIGNPLINHVEQCEVTARKIAEWRVAHEEPWIPISDMFPPEGQEVLLVWANQSLPAMRTGAYRGCRHGWIGSGLIPFKTPPTHWRFLPEGPKKRSKR